MTDELDSAIGLFDHCGAALDPVSAVVVSGAAQLMNGGRMNVAAQNSINPKFFGVTHDRFFKFADEADRVLYSLFRVSAERPVTETKSPADEIDRRIKRKQKLVSGIAQIGEPLRVLDDGVQFMSVNHENAATIRGDVNGVFLNRNVSVSAGKRADEFVVISGNVNNRHALAGFAQNLLNHVVVLLRPIATAAQLPNVDQITDDVEFFTIVIAKELKQRLGIAGPCSEMNIRDPGRAHPPHRFT